MRCPTYFEPQQVNNAVTSPGSLTCEEKDCVGQCGVPSGGTCPSNGTTTGNCAKTGLGSLCSGSGVPSCPTQPCAVGCGSYLYRTMHCINAIAAGADPWHCPPLINSKAVSALTPYVTMRCVPPSPCGPPPTSRVAADLGGVRETMAMAVMTAVTGTFDYKYRATYSCMPGFYGAVSLSATCAAASTAATYGQWMVRTPGAAADTALTSSFCQACMAYDPGPETSQAPLLITNPEGRPISVCISLLHVLATHCLPV
jgi:hypothetical protein